MGPKKQRWLGRLQSAIQKVRVLVSLDRSRWILSSFLTRSSTTRPRRLSFNHRPPGLLDCTDNDDDDDFHEAPSTFVLSRSSSSATDRSRSATPVSDITRSSSDVSSSADDIDRRADDFIANFYKHIRMERQVSLELRYLRAKDGSPPSLVNCSPR